MSFSFYVFERRFQVEQLMDGVDQPLYTRESSINSLGPEIPRPSNVITLMP